MNDNDYVSIRGWPDEDRPREKLLCHGEHTLSNSELLAILLRTGVQGQSALALARQVLAEFQSFRMMSAAPAQQWKVIKGLGDAKVAQVKAALEIGRRFREEETKTIRPTITSSKDIAAIFMPRMRDLRKEVVKAALLDAQNKIVTIVEVEEGTVNQANPILRELFQKALEHFAAALVCVHNHPSGNPVPSPQDKEFTRELQSAGKVLQVNVLDHIIIGDNHYYSFADEGLLQSF